MFGIHTLIPFKKVLVFDIWLIHGGSSKRRVTISIGFTYESRDVNIFGEIKASKKKNTELLRVVQRVHCTSVHDSNDSFHRFCIR